MLIKEYRICMPMPVEEYRIGQLYMIMKKSREESEGVDSGIEIIKNEPYTNGPGGNGGQYTFKIYHVGKHLPSWLRSLFPKSALCVYEEAWNAYPYTLTRFRTPFMEKFQLDIESRYLNDAGESENVFNLPPEELRQRDVVFIDIVRDHVSDYHASEDPKLYKSAKTGRGPLEENWRQEHLEEQSEDASKSENGIAPKTFDRKRIMCAYKLCRVEFRYWGMQTRVENFISEYALRKTLIRAHRQAWCWQDEFIDLSIEDIRDLERDVQKILAAKMKVTAEDSDGNNKESFAHSPASSGIASSPDSETNPAASSGVVSSEADLPVVAAPAAISDELLTSLKSTRSSRDDLAKTSTQSRDWSLDDEFFDAEEDLPSFLPSRDSSPGLSPSQQPGSGSMGVDGPVIFIVLLCDMPNDDVTSAFLSPNSISTAFATFTSTLTATAARFAVENVVSKRCIFKMFQCPNVAGEVANALANLTPQKYSLLAQKSNPFVSSHSNVLATGSMLLVSSDLGAKALENAVNALTKFTNEAVVECRAAFPDIGAFKPVDVCFLADGHSSVVLYEALTRWPANFDAESGEVLAVSGHRVRSSSNPADFQARTVFNRKSMQTHFTLAPEEPLTLTIPTDSDSILKSLPPPGLRSSRQDADLRNKNVESKIPQFIAKHCFFIGSPLGLILAHRMHCCVPEIFQPSCSQVYNVFYEIDPLACRIEPLLITQLGSIAPAELPRIQSWSWCDQNYNVKMALKTLLPSRESAATLMVESDVFIDPVCDINGFWGTKRIDYVLNCSHAELSNRVGIFRDMPHSALVQLLQASYWENKDLAAFILQEIFGNNSATNEFPSPKASVSRTESAAEKDKADTSPRRGTYEKWLKPHRLFKLRRPVPNHHASDVVVLNPTSSVTIRGRVAYGALDMIVLNGERIDCHIETSSSEANQDRVWHYVGTNLTDEGGLASFTINSLSDGSVELLSPGFHRVLLVVRGDHTLAALTLAVLPQCSRVALFSIDGSFSASLSLSGANPRLHAGCVEVVRHWAQAGYIIFYVSSRPDSQQNQVVGWLAKHNFPLGLMAFPSSGISSEPFRSKAAFIRQIVSEAKLDISAAYGSPKDIAIYANAGIDPHRIFIVGRAKRVSHTGSFLQRQDISINWLSDGYADHLRWLIASGFATFAPIQQWSLLRQWWSCVTPDFSLTSSLSLSSPQPSQVDGTSNNSNTSSNNNGNLLAAPPPLPPPRLTVAASQHRFISIAKDPTNGHTIIKNVFPNETN